MGSQTAETVSVVLAERDQLVAQVIAAQETLDRVTALAERWENATELGTGAPSVVMQAFAAELRNVIEGKEKWDV